jgi:serpin B
VAVLAVLPAACGGGADEEAAPVGDVVVVEADVERARPAGTAPVDDVVAGLDAFALRAEGLIAAETGGNTVLSPASIATAFAMVEAGADETTAAQIADVFGFPAEPGLHEAMNSLTATLDAANHTDPDRGEVVLDLANTLWAQRGFDIEQPFLDTLASQYGAGVPTTDFEHDPEGSRAAINEAVAEATRDRIPDLMQEGTVTADTRAVVVNAVYLKAPWATEFSEDATAPQAFHLPDGTTADVPMMHDPSLTARAAQTERYVAVELPYVRGDLAMLVVVPVGAATVDDVVADLGDGGFATVAAGLGDATVDLTLPRWDTSTAVDLGGVMTDLGLPIPGGTLPRMAPDLEIGVAVHAADITVDEAGTEAAAATAIGLRVTGAPPGQMVTVVADRPYLFAIRHVETGAPLFVGRVTDPRGDG